MKIKIEKMGINGEGIGYDNHLPVFIPGAIIGELVEAEIVERNRKYAHAKLLRVVKQSKERTKAPCRIQSRCGGCPIMIQKYGYQMENKKALLIQSLIKYAQVNPRLVNDIIKSEDRYNYRNQFKLPLYTEDRELMAGMYMPNSNFFIEVEKCLVHEEKLDIIKNKILKILNKYKYRSYDYKQKKGLRTLIVRGFDNKYCVTIVSGEHPLTPEVIDEIMSIEDIVSLWQSYNTLKKTTELFGSKMILLAGERYLPVEFDNLKIQLSPRSFFQLNTKQAINMYRYVNSLLEGKQYEFVVEAYSGVGAISLYIADKAKEIIGIESIKDAVVNANMNAKNNKISNVSFVCDDAANKLLYYSKNRKIDLLVVDPPRSGLDDNMVITILNSKIKEIIYISCNPATLGKNLKALSERYNIESIQPFDMFSHTAHVECVVLMSRI